MANKIIRLSGAGASGASGSGTSPAALQLTFTNSSGQVGVPYQAALVATGGVIPYTFAVGAGFPPGLTLDTASGTISGTPVTPGPYGFYATVTDFVGTVVTLFCAISVAMASGATPFFNILSVVGRAIPSTDIADPITRLVSFLVGCWVDFAAGATIHQYNTIYLSRDGGSNWVWINWYLWESNPQELSFYDVRPAGGATYKLAVVPGTVAGDPNALIPTASLPTAGRLLSATFAVAALALPSATLATSPTAGAGAGGNWPYNAVTPDGLQYWKIPSFTLALASAFADPNVFVITVTFQDLDASHAAIGPEHVYQSVVPVNGSLNLGELLGNYGTDGTSYTRTGNIAYVRARTIASNRYDQTASAWSDFVHTSVRQTDVGSGAGYVDIPVAAGGVPPAGQIAGVGDLRSFSFSSFADPSFENATPGLVIDPGGSLFGPGYLGGAYWLYQVIAPGTLTVVGSGGHNGGQFARMVGASTRVGQLLTTTGGATHFFSVWAQSSNNSSPNHILQFVAQWIDGSGGAISTTTITLLQGYFPSWVFISGFITAPAGAALVTFYFTTGASEPSSDYWDIDDLYAQGTIDQTANNQRNTTNPAAGTGDYSALRALSTVDNSRSYYGRQRMELWAPDGGSLVASVSTGAAGVAATSAGVGGGTAQLFAAPTPSMSLADGSNFIIIQLVSGVPTITMLIAGVLYTAYTGTVNGAVAAGKAVKNGLIVN